MQKFLTAFLVTFFITLSFSSVSQAQESTESLSLGQVIYNFFWGEDNQSANERQASGFVEVVEADSIYNREVEKYFNSQYVLFDDFAIRVILDSHLPEISMTAEEYEDFVIREGLNENGGSIRYDLDGGSANCHGYALAELGIPGFSNRMWVMGMDTRMTPRSGREFQDLLTYLFAEPVEIDMRDLELANDDMQNFFAQEGIDISQYMIVFWDQEDNAIHTGLPFEDNDLFMIRSKDRQYPVIDSTLQFLGQIYRPAKISIHKKL